jgi:hypothetical protein
VIRIPVACLFLNVGVISGSFSGFVARRRHDAALARPADGDRLAAEIRIVPLLDRRVEG